MDGGDLARITIIREVNTDAPNQGASQGEADSTGRSDPRLSEARRLLEELKGAEGTDALSPARRLADLLEELLEESEEARS